MDIGDVLEERRRKAAIAVGDALTDKLNGERRKAVSFLIMTAVLWSLGGVLIKLVSWNPIAIAGARSAIAALFILALVRRPHFTWSSAQIGAMIAYATTVILFVAANKLTTAANAILLQYTSPIYAAFLSAWLLEERATWLDWVTIGVTMGGIALFFLDDLAISGLWGNVCAIASGVAFAVLAVLLRKQKEGVPLESVLLGNSLTALIGIPFMLRKAPAPADWGVLLILGVVQLGFSYVLYSAAIKHVTALDAILIPAVEPILNPVWVFLALREAPGPWAIFGGAIVLISVTARSVLSALLPAPGTGASTWYR
ncbi:MAG: DMT family transporter [Chloroflexota bacterium]|nr:DMT family transporter [Chloroflexota bacterium]